MMIAYLAVIAVYLFHLGYGAPTSDTECTLYQAISDRIADCKKPFEMRMHAINERAYRDYLQNACAKKAEVMDCVRRETESCENKDFLRNEVETTLSVCDDSGWVYRYALPGLSDVLYQCIFPYYRRCEAVLAGFRMVNETTPLQEGMDAMKANVQSSFRCFMAAAQYDASNAPSDCSRVWMDSFFYSVIPIVGTRDLGIRLYPEQIAQLPALKAARDEN